ncbi:MAG: hypothetical protein WD227_14525, partial [Vicinamibacterales bacterium]
IAAGTSTPGRFFHERLRAAGPGDTAAPSGTIEPGRRADLLLVGADPLANVRNIALIEGVMVRGRWRPAER